MIMNQFVAWFKSGSDLLDYPINAKTYTEAKDQASKIADEQGLKLVKVEADL
jgi:hypothetical protein